MLIRPTEKHSRSLGTWNPGVPAVAVCPLLKRKGLHTVLITLTALLFAACGTKAVQSREAANHQKTRVGSTLASSQKREPAFSSHVIASWYGPGYEGRRTATGEDFDPNKFTAASKTLPLGSIVRVTNVHNGRSVDVRVNDRGPVASSRGIDLSPAAAKKIGLIKNGVERVKITRLRH